jgi:Aspartyl protease
MAFATRDTRFGGVVLAGIAALGIIAMGADLPAPEQTLREKGLVRSGTTYLLKEADDLRERTAELNRRFAEWKREKAGLDEQLETLGRLRLEHQELMKKLRALSSRWPDSKDFGPRRFPDGGPGGPGPPPPDSGPFQRGNGPPPRPPDDMGGFGPMDDMMRQLGINDSRRQFSVLNADRAVHAVEIISRQVFSEDLARKLERQLLEIDERRLEAVDVDKEIRARHEQLASNSEVKRALATLNESRQPKVSLGRPRDYSKELSELGDALTAARQGMLKQLAQVELKGMNRLTGLVAVAETLVQEMGASLGRMQTLEREAASRRRLLAEQAKPQESMSENPRNTTDATQKNRLTPQVHAKESRAETLRAESNQIRESLREVVQHLASEREDYVRIVKALKDAIDEAEREREPAPNGTKTQESTKDRPGGDRNSGPIGPIEPFKTKLRDFEKAIHSETVAIDADKTIRWVDASLNGKPLKPMMIDLGIAEIRLSARLAAEIGVLAAPGDPATGFATIDGRTIPARRGRLETITVGPFTYHDVDCLVLPEKTGDVPPVLGGEFFNQFSTRIDAGAGVIVLTQVQVKPIHQTGKAAITKSAGSSRNKKTAPAK